MSGRSRVTLFELNPRVASHLDLGHRYQGYFPEFQLGKETATNSVAPQDLDWHLQERFRMRSNNGFSLIELLIVVAIILIIAAIAIPSLLQARMAAHEASAAGCLTTMKSAETTYYTAYPSVGFSPDIASLGGPPPCTPSATTACIIDSGLSSATPGSVGKGGYYFLATGIKAAGATFNTTYVLGAAPIAVHSTGNRDFCSASDGVLRSQMGSPGDVPVNNLSGCFSYPVQQ
jgi:type IV pilus assembly protein PilA